MSFTLGARYLILQVTQIKAGVTKTPQLVDHEASESYSQNNEDFKFWI